MPLGHPAAVELGDVGDIAVGPQVQALALDSAPHAVDGVALDLTLCDDGLKAEGVIVRDSGLLRLLRRAGVPHHLQIAVADGVVVVDGEGHGLALVAHILIDIAHQERGGVRVQIAVLRADLVELLEDRLLDFDLLRHVLNDEVSVLAGLFERRRVMDAAADSVGLVLCELPLFDEVSEPLIDLILAGVDRRLRAAVAGHVLAVERVAESDHRPLSANADNGYVFDVIYFRHIAPLKFRREELLRLRCDDGSITRHR